ncbi:MAG: DUF3090 family protein [Candidatus Dormibacteria bacterium]
MANLEVDFEPVDVITVGVEGEPGRRTFFLEARQGQSSCTLILEKAQVLELGAQILATLEPVEGHSGWAPDPIHGASGAPGWRVGSIQISLGEPDGTCTLLLEEQRMLLIGDDEPEGTAADPEDLRAVRLVATTNQLRRLGESAVGVVGGGRPICPLCHQPKDEAGHVCPATNGHHSS